MQRKGLHFLREAAQVSRHGCWAAGGVPGHVTCVRVSACLCVVVGHVWDAAGAIPRDSAAQLQQTLAALDLAFPCSLPDVADLCPWPKLRRMVWIPVARPLGRPLSHALGPAGHIGQRARAGVWDLGFFFEVLPATFSRRCADTLCSARFGGVAGGDMNVTGGDTFCLCFKESDVPFVNIQEKY